MKLKKGDLVRYLNDVGGGVVSRILSNTMVEIEDDSGFAIPVLESELVFISSLQDNPQAEQDVLHVSTESIAEEIEIEGNDIPSFYIAFTRTPNKQNTFDVYIINDCNYHASFVFAKQIEDAYELCETGIVEANTKCFIRQFTLEELSQITEFSLQTVVFKKKAYEKRDPWSARFQLQAVKFYKPGVFVVNDFFEEDAYVVLFQEEKRDIQEEYSKATDSADAYFDKVREDLEKNTSFIVSTQNKKELKEVDLHIHELVENESLLNATQMLDMQIKAFEKELLEAKKQNYEKVVFIHGVGNGVLKAKIRAILQRDYPYYYFQDASFQKYKFGATLVYFKKVYK